MLPSKGFKFCLLPTSGSQLYVSVNIYCFGLFSRVSSPFWEPRSPGTVLALARRHSWPAFWLPLGLCRCLTHSFPPICSQHIAHPSSSSATSEHQDALCSILYLCSIYHWCNIHYTAQAFLWLSALRSSLFFPSISSSVYM